MLITERHRDWRRVGVSGGQGPAGVKMKSRGEMLGASVVIVEPCSGDRFSDEE